MTKTQLKQEVLELLDTTPEFKLFHVKPLTEQIKVLSTISDNFSKELRCLRNKNRKSKKDKQNRRQKVLQRIAHVHYLLNYLDNLAQVLVQQALEQSKANKQDSKAKYRYRARFIFSNPKDLLRVKGYSLLVKFGFYNKKTNPNGVVKDHRLSIKYGIDHKIDPAILGHLANCEFLLYKDNIQKSSNSSITYHELLADIEKW